MNLSAREQRLALASGGVLLVVVLYLAMDRWVIPTWQNSRKRIADAKKDLARTRDVVAAEDRRRAEYAACVDLALHEPGPAEAELEFRKRLNVLATAAGMNSPNITGLSSKDEKHYDLIQFNFTIKCTFDQFFAFLRQFYQHKGAHRIDSITVRPSGRYLSNDDMLSVTMLISAVVIPEGGKKPAKAPSGKGA